MTKQPGRLTRSRGSGGGARPQLQKPRRKSWTMGRRETFLAELAATCNVSAAARAAGMCPQGAYRLRDRDAGFRAAWMRALGEGYERLELMMLERAMFGVEKHVWYRGEQVGSMRSYGDATGLALLRMHRDTVKGASAPDAQDVEAARARLAAKFSEMNRNMGGDG